MKMSNYVHYALINRRLSVPSNDDINCVMLAGSHNQETQNDGKQPSELLYEPEPMIQGVSFIFIIFRNIIQAH